MKRPFVISVCIFAVFLSFSIARAEYDVFPENYEKYGEFIRVLSGEGILLEKEAKNALPPKHYDWQADDTWNVEYKPVNGSEFTIVYENGEFSSYSVKIVTDTYAYEKLGEISIYFFKVFGENIESFDMAVEVVSYLTKTIQPSDKLPGITKRMGSKYSIGEESYSMSVIIGDPFGDSYIIFYISDNLDD